MALQPAGVQLVIEGQQQFSAGMDSAEQSVLSFGGVTERVGGMLGGFATAAAGVAAVAGGALVAGLGGAAAAGFSFNNAVEQAEARINAFTKDAGATAEILEMVRERAANTPFAFEEMANAAAGLGPVAKAAGVPLEDLIAQAEILAASNPAEGLEGAVVALKEAASGDFVSAIERFNLSRSYINDLREQGVPDLEALSMAMQQAGYDADLVSALANTAAGRMSTFADTFTNLAGTVTQPIFDAFSAGMGEVNSALSEGTPILESAAAALGEALVPAAQWLGEAMAGAATGLVAFIDTVTNADGSLKSFGEIWATFAPVIQEGAAGALEAVGQFALDIGQRILDGLPGMVANLQAIGGRLLAWAGEQAPGWLASLQALGAGLGQWVTDNLPTMLGKLMDARTALVTWVLDSLPGWLGELAKLGAAMGQWVVDALPGLGTNLGKVTAELLRGTGELIAVAVPKLLELGGNFITWVATEVLPKLPGELVKVGGALLTGIGNFISEIAPEIVKLAQKFISWVQDEVLPKAPGELAKIGTAVVEGIGAFLTSVDAEARKIGTAIIDGIKNAVSGAAGQLSSAVTSAVTSALNDAKATLGIKSPSRVFADEVGAPIVQGMAQGMLDNLDVLLDAAADISWAVLEEAKAFAGTIQDAVGPLFAAAFEGAAQFARGQIGALDALDGLAPDTSGAEKLARDYEKLADEIAKLERPGDGPDIGGLQKSRRETAGDADARIGELRKESDLRVRDLEADAARLRFTAANNYDPEKRARAEEELIEVERRLRDERTKSGARIRAEEDKRAAALKAIDDDIAARRAAYAADEAEREQRLTELKLQRQILIQQTAKEEERIGRARQIQIDAEQALAAAQREALKLADPAERAAFLELQTRQITERARLEQRIATETNDHERVRLQERLGLLQTAQAAELAGYQQQAKERRASTDAALRDAAEAVKQLGNLVYFSQQDVNGMGQDVVKGIAKGILDQLGALQGTLGGALDEVLAAARRQLGIASPSRLFAEQVGAPLAAGIAAGFDAEVRRLTPALTAQVQALVTPVQRAAGAVTTTTTYGPAISIDARGAAPGVERAIGREVGAALNQRTSRSDIIRRTR